MTQHELDTILKRLDHPAIKADPAFPGGYLLNGPLAPGHKTARLVVMDEALDLVAFKGYNPVYGIMLTTGVPDIIAVTVVSAVLGDLERP